MIVSIRDIMLDGFDIVLKMHECYTYSDTTLASIERCVNKFCDNLLQVYNYELQGYDLDVSPEYGMVFFDFKVRDHERNYVAFTFVMDIPNG